MQAKASSAAAVTFKSLPGGERFAAVYRGMEGSLLELEMIPDDVLGAEIPKVGNLLEVQTENTIYLGKVDFLRGHALGIRCEHSVDLQILRDIRRRWSLRDDIASD